MTCRRAGSRIAIAIAAMGLGVAMGATAPAGAETLLGQHRDWTARSYEEGGAAVCNMFSAPKRDEGDYTTRGEIIAFVTHRPDGQQWNVLAFDMGYPIQEGSEVTVEIGSESFSLFTRGDLAFSYPRDDAALVRAMRAGAEMIVRGTSARGTATRDTYSLIGFTAAHDAINRACDAPGS